MKDFDCKIGKGMLKICMGDNYTDATVVFREYVQNAIDAIYQAEEQKISSEIENYVAITIEHGNITIEDKGIGVKASEIGPKLVSLGCSTKTYSDIGQYGIGRLSGANWCDEIIFETSYHGEPIRSILTFDSKYARQLVNDENEQECSDIMNQVTSYDSKPATEEEHYFKVTLINIKEELRNEEVVKKYLSFIAPVPYESTFYDDCQKNAFLKNPEFKELSDKERTCKIHLNKKPIYKPYMPTIHIGNDLLKIASPSFFKLSDEDYGDLAWGWYAINVEAKQMGEDVDYKGLRLRAKNMAVGSQDYLISCFKNKTDANYIIGEVFIMNDNIQPTGSRDGIKASKEYNELLNRLVAKCKEIKNIYNTMSKIGSGSFAPIIESHIANSEKKFMLKSEDLSEEKKAELEAEIKSNNESTERAKNELSGKLRAIERCEDTELMTDAVIKNWKQKSKTRIKSHNEKATSGHKIPLIDFDDIISSANKEEERDTDNSTNSNKPSATNKDKKQKTPTAPKETDIYSTLGKSEHNLMKKVYRVINSESRLDDKTKEKIKNKLAKKILGE